MPSSMYIPLFIVIFGLLLLSAAFVLKRLQVELLQREGNTVRVRELVKEL
jgi:hypothetical protein